MKSLIRTIVRPEEVWTREELLKAAGPVWVRTHCPGCLGKQVFLVEGHLVWCLNPECEDPEAAQRLLWGSEDEQKKLRQALASGQVKIRTR